MIWNEFIGSLLVTKKIYLLRHAKSDWANMAISDHDRPLNSRGKEAADLIGHKLASFAFAPDIVVCSTALRAMETLDRVRKSGGFAWHVEHRRRLYGASADTLLTAIHRQDSTAKSVFLVGHNPGLQDLALALASNTESDMYHHLDAKLPTGGFLCLEFDVDSFPEISVGSGKLTHFLRPKHEFLR